MTHLFESTHEQLRHLNGLTTSFAIVRPLRPVQVGDRFVYQHPTGMPCADGTPEEVICHVLQVSSTHSGLKSGYCIATLEVLGANVSKA